MKVILLTCLICIFSSLHAQQKMFTEVSTQLGMDYTYPGNEFQMDGGGVMVIDVNRDGWDDVFQSGGVFDSKLWLNNKGTFKDATAAFGLDKLHPFFVQSAVGADFNNDGYSDFLIANFGEGMKHGDHLSPMLLMNRKGKYFDTLSLGNVLPPANYTSACVGDLNKDGFTDVYLTNYVASMGGIYDSNGVEIGYDPVCYENKLLLNQRGKGFIECAELYGVNDPGCGLAASFTDADRDGDLDLLLLNDFGEWSGLGNRYFRNDYPKSAFTDLSSDMGWDQKMYGMGIGQGDYDNDGDPDYYVTNIGKNYLFRNENTSFRDCADSLKLDITYVQDTLRGTSWSGLFFDRENDGDLDLFVSKGNVLALLPRTAIRDKNKYFEQENGGFSDRSTESGLDDILSHRGSALFDFDHDGDLDIVSGIVKLPLVAFANLEQKIKLFRNDTGKSNWIGLELAGGNGMNSDCFGCSILVPQNGNMMYKEVDGGSGHGSQSTRILYIGLGNQETTKNIQVNWADGTVLKLPNLKSGHVYCIDKKGKLTIRY